MLSLFCLAASIASAAPPQRVVSLNLCTDQMLALADRLKGTNPGNVAFLTVPPGPPFPEELHGRQVCGIVWHYNGTPEDAAIRVSSRLAAFPSWVLDYVIVHELCHLEVRGHGPEFWKLVHRFPKAERAIGYLIAKSGDEHE